jgi:hypothetical protein
VTKQDRLDEIAAIIEAVDNRAQAGDGPVPSTMQEMEQKEMSRIYALAKGRVE